MNKKYRVTLDLGDEHAFRLHIGDNIFKFPNDDDGIYLSKTDKIVFRKVAEYNKSNMIEVLHYLKTVGSTKKVFRKRQYKRSLVARKIYHMVGVPTLKFLKMMIRQNIIKYLPVTVEKLRQWRRYLVLMCLP